MFHIYRDTEGKPLEFVSEHERLDDAQYALKEFLGDDYSRYDNITYWTDDEVRQMRYEVFTANITADDPCAGYKGEGWYKADTNGYSIIMFKEQTEGNDFWRYSYDNWSVYIEEFSAEFTLENLFMYPVEFEEMDINEGLVLAAEWYYSDDAQLRPNTFWEHNPDTYKLIENVSQRPAYIQIRESVNYYITVLYNVYYKELVNQYLSCTEDIIVQDEDILKRFAIEVIDRVVEKWNSEDTNTST